MNTTPRQSRSVPRTRGLGTRATDACIGFVFGAVLGAVSYILDALFPETSPFGGSGFLTSIWSAALWFGGFAAAIAFVFGRAVLDYFTVR